MRTHELRCWPEHFENLWTGRKPFEVRNDDRGFMVGDILLIREWDPAPSGLTKTVNMGLFGEQEREAPVGYSGRWMRFPVLLKMVGTGDNGIQPGICILGLAPSTERGDKWHQVAAPEGKQ